jgi:hypothetical protein
VYPVNRHPSIIDSIGAALFYLHRSYFVQAIEGNPKDPFSHKYAQSVVAAYTSAQLFVALSRSFYTRYEHLATRAFFGFQHIFSCAVRSEQLLRT